MFVEAYLASIHKSTKRSYRSLSGIKCNHQISFKVITVILLIIGPKDGNVLKIPRGIIFSVRKMTQKMELMMLLVEVLWSESMLIGVVPALKTFYKDRHLREEVKGPTNMQRLWDYVQFYMVFVENALFL